VKPPAIILAAAIVLAAIIWAWVSRYQIVQTTTGMYTEPYVLDRWTGEIKPLKRP
jgi:hypothetical protein